LLETERAHTNPNLPAYCTHLLFEGTDLGRLLHPDLQNIVGAFVGPMEKTAEAQSSAAVIAVAAEADEHARAHGRVVCRRVE
jgi:hypothetical protein